MSVHIFCQFSNWIVLFWNIEFWKFFVYSRYKPLFGYVICRICSPPSVCVFLSSSRSLSQSKVFEFWWCPIDQGWKYSVSWPYHCQYPVCARVFACGKLGKGYTESICVSYHIHGNLQLSQHEKFKENICPNINSLLNWFQFISIEGTTTILDIQVRNPVVILHFTPSFIPSSPLHIFKLPVLLIGLCVCYCSYSGACDLQLY